mmetsp:Transcript_53865/g.161172  ORF Transcript_53865/g.161172 Transcript_53865/m.161172 type:complete len:209 (-) Transcript_53865:561-1187(-)
MRPVATRRHSHSISCSVPLEELMITFIRGNDVASFSSPGRIVSTRLTVVSDRKRTPSSSNDVWMISAASTSPPLDWNRYDDRWTTVTSLPKLANVCAISSATTPAPNMTIRGGRVWRLNNSALVVYGASISPSTGGMAALPPVAITALRNFSSLPSSTWMVSGDTNFPLPWNTCAPVDVVPSCPSAGAMVARIFLIRSITLPKLTDTD